jgi:hypothetical protein
MPVGSQAAAATPFSTTLPPLVALLMLPIVSSDKDNVLAGWTAESGAPTAPGAVACRSSDAFCSSTRGEGGTDACSRKHKQQ